LLSEAHEFQVSAGVKVKTRDEETARSLAAGAGGGRRARAVASAPNSKAVERTAQWRKDHPEEYRTYMRNYMRERRARGGA
jgi:hypothetical protein